MINKIGMKYFIVNDKRFNSFRIKINSKTLMQFVECKLNEFENFENLSNSYKV